MDQGLKIVASNSARYNNSLFTQLHYQIYKLVMSGMVELAKLYIKEALMMEWKEYIDLLEEINLETLASAMTAKMKELDTSRTDQVNHIFGVIRVSVTSPIKAEKEAAERLVLIVNKYNGIQRDAVDQKSQHIRGLINDLMKDTVVPDVEALGLGAKVEALDSTNSSYQTYRDQRTDERAASKLPNSKEVRPQADACYKRVCQLIEASYLINELEADRTAIAALIDKINQTITELKTSFRQSQGQKASQKEEEETTPETEE